MVRASVRIEGGFVLVNVASLVVAWRACRSRPLGIGDFRTWLACHELRARRQGLDDERAPTYGLAELVRLTGTSEKRARASLGRLVAAGLLQWSESAIGLPDRSDSDLGLADTIGGGRGPVAIPRRIIRLLAGGARPALIATALGVLLRCLSRRRAGFDGRGRVKAAWIARAFAVDIRRVKQARLELVELGWIVPEPADQWAMNRWGRAYRIDLAWDRAHVDGRRLPPPAAVEGPRLPPPVSDPDPFQEEERNQEPAGRGSTGVRLGGEGEEDSPLPAPTLDDIRPEDLRDVGRALQLFDQAVGRKLVDPSEDGRLKFLAIAEHARAVGSANPCGLFARLVGRGWWHFATQDDEDVARRQLRMHLREPSRSPGRAATTPGPPVPDGSGRTPPTVGDVLGALAGRFSGSWPIPR